MAKTKETLELEEKLHYMCSQKHLYGCEEVTIGFANNGHGNEIVDFCTMDSKGVIKCYEIKVTLSDLKSKAKKSWYGHYNYLFVTPELYEKIYKNINEYVPEYVGVAIPCPSSWSCGVEIRRAAKKKELSLETEIMMKESMIRSMSYKMKKYRESCDIEKMAELKRKLLQKEKENNRNSNEAVRYKDIINRVESVLRRFYGKDIVLEEIAAEMVKEEFLFPESISLQLNERGKERNIRTQEIMELLGEKKEEP